ncbi:MAG TPA: hypothetical protein VGE00_09640 [Gammaproteobacteria bacterium]
MADDNEIVSAVDAAFAHCARPEHFTYYKYCEECREHDQTLRSASRDKLTREQFGVIGWDPVTFCSAPAKAYLFPRLVRLALSKPDARYGWYGDQLISHLCPSSVYYSATPCEEFTLDEFYTFCTQEMRVSVTQFILHLIETRGELIDEIGESERFLYCHELWRLSEGGVDCSDKA